MRSAIPLARERCLGYRFFSEPPSRLPAKRRTEIRLSSEDTHTLTLDGKVDDIVLQGLNPYNQSDRLITDIRQLSGKATDLREACLKSEDIFANAEVDLGTGSNWYCFPQKDSQTHQTYGYELVSGPGPQTVSVRLEDNGVVDVCVSSKDKARDLGHSMRAKIAPDGSCQPTLEGVSWQLSR